MFKSFNLANKLILAHDYHEEYLECISDLLELDDVKRLTSYNQHMGTNRLDHSLNVSFSCYLLCKKLSLDFRSAARAGLLHDLFLYDWTDGRQPEGNHASAHPRIALRNARKNIKLNKIEENAILRHMWPLTLVPPKYKESMLLSLMDKYCCMLEISWCYAGKIRALSTLYKGVYSGGSWAK